MERIMRMRKEGRGGRGEWENGEEEEGRENGGRTGRGREVRHGGPSSPSSLLDEVHTSRLISTLSYSRHTAPVTEVVLGSASEEVTGELSSWIVSTFRQVAPPHQSSGPHWPVNCTAKARAK